MAKRVIKATESSKAGIEVTENSIKLVGSNESFVVINEKGVYLGSKLSFIANTEDIRMGGMFVQTPLHQQMLPSTITTPVPNVVFNPPLSGIQEIADILAEVSQFLL